MSNTGNFFSYTSAISEKRAKEEHACYLNRTIIEQIVEQYGPEMHWRFRSNVADMEKAAAKGKMMGYEIHDFENGLVSFKAEHQVTIYSEKQITLPEDASLLWKDIPFLTINLKGVDTSNVKSMKGMFMGSPYAYQVDEIDMSDCDVSKVTDLSFLFCNCTASKIKMFSVDLSKVKEQNAMFSNCKAQLVES